MSCTALMIDPLGRWFNSNLGQPAPISQVLSVSRLERRKQVALRIVPRRIRLRPETALFSGYFAKAGQVFAPPFATKAKTTSQHAN